jgi:hypothetical protein
MYVNLSRTCRQVLLLTAVTWLVDQMCHASPDCLFLVAEACSSLLWGVSGGMLRDHLAASRQLSVVSSLPGVTAWQLIEWYPNHSPSSRPTGEEALLLTTVPSGTRVLATLLVWLLNTAWLCAARPLL